MKEIPILKRVEGSNWMKIIAYALVDDKHYAELDRYTWTLHRGYPQRYDMDIRKSISMHLDIWCRLEGHLQTGHSHALLDHEDRNPLNNQLYNLRPATNSQSSANRGLNSNSTTGYRGVTWDRIRNKYKAQIMVNRKNLYLGLFKTALEAAKAYDKAAIEHFGEFAVTNQSLDLPNITLQL